MARLRNFWRQFIDWCISPRGIAAILGVIGLVILLAGHLYYYADWWPQSLYLAAGWEKTFEALWANVGTTLVGVTLVVYTVEWAGERRAEQQLKEQLIREMGNPSDAGITNRAVRELRAHRWLADGLLRGADLSAANLRGADLQGANLQGAYLVGAHLEDANLQTAILYKSFLKGANLKRANLTYASLHEASFQEAILEGATLERAILEKTVLYKANLKGANLEEANLKGANLEEANLKGANLEGANLEGADLFGANLEGAIVTKEQLATAILLGGATMPDGSKPDCAAERTTTTTAMPRSTETAALYV